MSADVKLRIAVTGATEARSELSGLERQMGRTADSVRNIGAAGLGLAVLLPMFQNLLSGAVAMADAITTLDNRLKLSTGSAAAASVAFEDLYQAAQSSRTSFTELGAVYSTMARAGFTNITVTKAIGDAMAISGGSAASMQAALVQLGQGMAAGALRGEELNSVMEQAPRLAQALADGLGVPIGELRKLGEAGELTSQKVVDALTRSAPKLAEEVKNSIATVSQGMTVIGNSTTRLVSDFDKAVGGSAALAKALIGLAGALDSVGSVVNNNKVAVSAFVAGISGVAAVAGVTALIGGLTKLAGVIGILSAALVANPAVLALLGIGVAVGGVAAVVSGISSRTKELDTYAGKLKELKQLQDQLDQNTRVGRGEAVAFGGTSLNASLRERITLLREEIKLAGTDALRRAEAGMTGKADEADTRLQAQLTEVLNKSAGVTKEYTESLNVLQRAYEAGLIPQAEYVRQVNELIMKTTAGKAVTKDAAEAQRAALAIQKELEADFNRATNDYLKEREERAQKELELILGLNAAREKRAEDEERAADDRIRSADSMVQSIERETMLMGMSNREKEISIALWALEEKGITAGSYAYEQFAEKLKAAITTRDEVRKSTDAYKDEAERIKRVNEQIGQSLTDALMNGGKNAFDYIQGLFRTMVFRPVIEAIVRPVAGSLTGLLGLGGTGAAMAGQSGAGGAGGVLGSLGSLGSLISGAGAAGSFGLTGLMSTLTGNAGASFGAAGSLLGSGSIGAGLGMAAGTALPFIAGAVAIKKLTDSLFGRKLADTGVEGSFGAGGDFGGSGYQFLKGGFFRSDKTVRSPLDEALEQVLDAGGKAASEQAKAYAEALGLPVQAVEGYTQAIKVSFNGLDEAGQKAAIEKLITDYQEGLFGQFNAQLGPLRKVGETLAQTAQRLAGLQTFTEGLAELGGVFGRVAGLTVDAREQLIGFAGGMENLAGLARGYVENYFNREEIAGLKAREIQDVLSGVGLDGSGLSSRGDFRSLVESIDVSSEAGRRQLTALLGVQGSFAGVSDFLSETGGTLGTTAASAPEAGVLGALFSDGSAAQVDAINGVSSGVATTNNLLTQLIATVQENAAPTVIERDWTYEVGGA